MIIFKQFILGVGASYGFASLFKCPRKAIFFAGVVGGIGWIAYYIFVYYLYFGVVISSFLATVIIGFLCEVLARIKKDAITIFLIPAIFSLVPGSSMYYTLLYFISGNYKEASNSAINTIGVAGSIAIAILITSSLTKFVYKLIELKNRKVKING